LSSRLFTNVFFNTFHVTRHRLIMTIFTPAFTAGQHALRSSEAGLPVGERTTHALRR
jgi:stress-induced morphogen